MISVTTEIYEMDFTGKGSEIALKPVQAIDLEIGQIFFLNGYGQCQYSHDRKAIYAISGKGREKLYKWVNLDKPARGTSNSWEIKPVEKLFGIGHYYKANDMATPEEIENAIKLAIEAEEVQRIEKEQKEQENARLMAIGKQLYADNIPQGAKAIIIAEHEENTSDLMSDYHGSDTTRTVYLAFSGTERNNFQELRKAADTFEETKHLGVNKGIFTVYVKCNETFEWNGSYYREGERSHWHRELEKTFTLRSAAETHIATAEEIGTVSFDGKAVSFRYAISEKEIEHRENYSGGAGCYLGEHRYSGWKLSKKKLAWLNEYDYTQMGIEGNFLALKTFKHIDTDASQPASTSAEGVTIIHNEKQNGIEIKFNSKPEQETIDSIKSSGFRWSKFNKCWYRKIDTKAIETAKKFGTLPASITL